MKPMKTTAIAATAALMLLAPVAATAAPTISMGSAMIDTGSNWRSGTAVTGQAGYYLPGANQRVLMPSFVASFAPNASVYQGNDRYVLIDDPLTTPGATPTKIESGTFNPIVGAGNSATDFAFTVGANAPATIRVGLLFDNLDVTTFNSTSVQFIGGGTSASIDLTGPSFNNGLADWVFFDVAGATAGDTFSIVTTAGEGTTATLGGVSFDAVSAVPEPASWAMMLIGFGGLGCVLRRRAKGDARVRFA